MSPDTYTNGEKGWAVKKVKWERCVVALTSDAMFKIGISAVNVGDTNRTTHLLLYTQRVILSPPLYLLRLARSLLSSLLRHSSGGTVGEAG